MSRSLGELAVRHGLELRGDPDVRIARVGTLPGAGPDAVTFLANPQYRKYLAKTIEAMRDICIARYEAFGTAGNADKIKVKSLERMYVMYEAGELTPKVN